MTRSRARPTETGQLVGVRLQPAEVAVVDEWRRKQADLPTRPEAIRRLIAAALESPTADDPKGARGKRSLKELYRAFLEADPKHLGMRGFREGTPIDEAIAQEFDERGQISGETLGKLRREARWVIDSFEYAKRNERGGAAAKICARLRKILK